MCDARRLGTRLVLGGLLLLLPLVRLTAQQDLEESRRRLEEVRKEREQLQRERERLQGQVHDLNQELDNLERQRQTTNRIVNELEAQIGGLNNNVDLVSAELTLAQDNLAEKRAVLTRRLVDIYKRGTMYPFEVLVAAESFGDLLSRYKYLYLTSRQDKALVTDVENLRDQVLKRRGEVVQIRSELDHRREERESELRRYGNLLQERATRLKAARKSAQTTEQRLTTLDRDEAKLNDVLENLERARKNAEARGGRPAEAAGPATLTTADIGKLDWPVDGSIIYNFGRQTLPSGGVIRRNGIGIAAPAGTAVMAVESGKVELVQSLGTYGLTIVLTHGNGYRSLYMHLAAAKVTRGQEVVKGQPIGTVGGANTDEGAHLYFEIRGENGIALDPADWLRKRR
jgi:septal ring factor EnvC (AmiA/AmiB activator)